MAKLSIVAGSTSKLLDVFVQDSSSTTGAGLTGLAFNTAGLTAYYYREGAATSTAITLATMTLGTWATGGFIVVDATNMPGCYQIGIPNAAIASGAKSVIVLLKGATNMAPLVLEIELTAVDNQDGVHFGLTALPNAASAASGGLPTIGATIPNATAGAAGGLFIAGTNAATTINGTAAAGATPASAALTLVGGAASTTGGGVSAPGLSATGGAGAATTNGASPGASFAGGGTTTVSGGDGIKATGTGNLNGIEGIGAGTGDGLAVTGGATGRGLHAVGGATSGAGALFAAAAGNSDGATFTKAGSGIDLDAPAITGNITGNLSGSVGSVTGAVGSVSGNVGGSVASVTGAVGSVTGNVGGNVVGSVASVTAAVTVGTNNDKTGYSLTQAFPTNFASMAIDASGRVTLVPGQILVKKNTQITITFPMTDSTTHAPKAGLGTTITCQRSIDGAAIGACVNANAELSGGLYSLVLAAADVNGTMITLILSAAGADTRFIGLVTQP